MTGLKRKFSTGLFKTDRLDDWKFTGSKHSAHDPDQEQQLLPQILKGTDRQADLAAVGTILVIIVWLKFSRPDYWYKFTKTRAMLITIICFQAWIIIFALHANHLRLSTPNSPIQHSPRL